MTTPDRLPTPNLLADDCVHGGIDHNAGFGCKLDANDCAECIDLALSRARDAGIEAAAEAASLAVRCTWCAIGGCACTDECTRVYNAVMALKEDRQR